MKDFEIESAAAARAKGGRAQPADQPFMYAWDCCFAWLPKATNGDANQMSLALAARAGEDCFPISPAEPERAAVLQMDLVIALEERGKRCDGV